LTGNDQIREKNNRGKFDMTANKIKILIGKPGLDGHDRGAKVIALALRDAGMEVIYTGLHQTVEQIVRIAVQEAVDVVGLSIMSGAHLPICQKLLEMMQKEGISGVPVVVGGVIPKQDILKLSELGVVGVFPGGTPFDEIVAGINEVVNF
jgi:methylmalonyl-CoA mutase C-terminal domain/subunit